jgi:O-antigen/teichoic acid export membrane protein
MGANRNECYPSVLGPTRDCYPIIKPDETQGYVRGAQVESTTNRIVDTNDVSTVSRYNRFYQRFVKNEYLVHNIIVFVGTILTGAFNYLLNPVLTHTLGLETYSKIVSLLGLLAVILTPTQIIGTIIAKYASSLGATGNYSKLNDLFRRLTAILLPLGIIIAIIFVSLSSKIAAFLQIRSQQQVMIMSIALIFAFIGPVSGGALQGLQRFSWYSAINVFTPISRLMLVIALIELGFGVNGALLGIVLSAALTYLLSLVPLRQLLMGPRASSGSLRPLFSYSITAVIALASSVLLLNMDTILAGHFLSAQKAGLYDGLAVIGRTVLFVSASVAAVMFPKAAAAHERGERTTAVVLQALLGVAALSASAEIVFLLVPRTVIQVLFHNPKLLTVANQLVWYGLAMLMLALAQTLISYFLSIGSRLFVVAVVSCCVFQATLIVVRHATVEDLVQAVVIANTVLFVVLFASFIARARFSVTTLVPQQAQPQDA